MRGVLSIYFPTRTDGDNELDTHLLRSNTDTFPLEWHSNLRLHPRRPSLLAC